MPESDVSLQFLQALLVKRLSTLQEWGTKEQICGAVPVLEGSRPNLGHVSWLSSSVSCLVLAAKSTLEELAEVFQNKTRE